MRDSTSLSEEVVDLCSKVIDELHDNLTTYIANNNDIMQFIYAFGGALGGYIYNTSQAMNLPLSDAFLEGFASFRQFLHSKGVDMTALLTYGRRQN